jgi:hypothetical protein
MGHLRPSPAAGIDTVNLKTAITARTKEIRILCGRISASRKDMKGLDSFMFCARTCSPGKTLLQTDDVYIASRSPADLGIEVLALSLIFS